MITSNFRSHKDFFQDKLRQNIKSGLFDQNSLRGTGRSTYLSFKVMEHILRKKKVAIVTHSFQGFDSLISVVKKIAMSYSGIGSEAFNKNEWWNDDFYPRIFYVQSRSWYEDLLGRRYDVLMIDNEVVDDYLKMKKGLKEFSLDPALELSRCSYSEGNIVFNNLNNSIGVGDLIKWGSGCALITDLNGASGKLLDISILYENQQIHVGGDIADFLEKIDII